MDGSNSAGHCPSCSADLDKDNRFITPDIRIVALVLQRQKPSAWPKNGIPVTFKEYGSLYNVLLLSDPEGDGNSASGLPTTIARPGMDPHQSVLSAWGQIKAKRALFVDCVTLDNDAYARLLYVLPVDTNEETGDFTGVSIDTWKQASWAPLASVFESMHGLRSPSHNFSAATSAMLARLDKWLLEQHKSPESVLTIWKPPAYHRTRRITANKMGQANMPVAKSSLEPKRHFKNLLFKSPLVLPRSGTSLEVNGGLEEDYAEARPDITDRLMPNKNLIRDSYAQDSDEEVMTWADRFPLHRAACEGQAETVRTLIEEGFIPGEADDDSWTPLHYACWYGKEQVVRVLMEDWQGNPGQKTDAGSTALHFAARNGYPEIVKVLLACPIVDATQQDDNKETPLSLCEGMQQNSWEACAHILKNPQGLKAENRFSRVVSGEVVEHRISLLDGSVKVVRLPGGGNINAVDLRNAVAGLCHVPEEAYHAFGLWYGIPGLELQLKDEEIPSQKLLSWQATAEVYGDENTDRNVPPTLMLKRNQYLTLHKERKIRSVVALKLLFDEAVHNFITSKFPTTVDQAVDLAGLLMQIRFGDHNPDRHKPGFLKDAFETFIPQHLLHNQLKLAAWEQRIFKSHKQYKKKTDILLLHRLFLQYCWQWSFYGSVWFFAGLTKAARRVFGPQRTDMVQVGINSEWITIVHREANRQNFVSMPYNELRHDLDESAAALHIQLLADVPGLREIPAFAKGAETIHFLSRQSYIMTELMDYFVKCKVDDEQEQEKQRIAQAQGGRASAVQHQQEVAKADADYEKRQTNERMARYSYVHSFGQSLAGQEKFASQVVFDKLANSSGLLGIRDLKQVCYELGYWLGPEYDGARSILSGGSAGSFSFRDLVSWWTQSNRNWLFLLDDQAFLDRRTATEIFLRNDPQRLGMVSDEKLLGLIRGLKAEKLTSKPEDACLQGLDPDGTGVVRFNMYINWLARMGIITERLQ